MNIPINISNRTKILATLGLIALLSTGGIFAYLTDQDAAANQFTVGKVDFNLYEESWDGERPDGTYGTPSDATPSDATPSDALGIDQAQDMYAGKVINKNPAIKNNSKNDVYLRMSVKIPAAEVVTVQEDGTISNGGYPILTELFTYEENPGTGMRRVSDYPTIATDSNATPATGSDASRAYYVYEYEYVGDGDTEIPLPAGQDIPPLFDQVVFANVIEGQIDENTEFISVDYKAIQSGGFDTPEEAWNAYNNQHSFD